MKALRYFLVLTISIGLVVIPVGLLLFVGYRVYKDGFDNTCLTLLAVGAGMIVLRFLLKKPLQKLEIKGRRDVEYDEFGRSKRKGDYEKLSRAEQDAIDLQKTAQMEMVVSTSVLKKMTHEGSLNPERDMDNLIGLAPVKAKMEEMVARIRFENETKSKKDRMAEKSTSGRHMVFYGSPGTGKTTVARIITGFLYKYKYIPKNKCVEVDGNFLKAGENTALKTEMVIRQAFDGVLFVDEAYSLADSYSGVEAIATIIKQMEDNRGRFILILAGYTKEMQDLLNANPGFSSRIKEYLVFPDYSIPELEQIFCLMAKDLSFRVDESALPVFDTRLRNEQMFNSFGNARTVRNVLDETIDRHALNYMRGRIPASCKAVIVAEDISTVPKNAENMA